MKLAGKGTFLVLCIIAAVVRWPEAEGEFLSSKIRYGIELIRRLFNQSSSFWQFSGIFKKEKDRNKNFRNSNDLFMAIIRTVVGDEYDVAKAGLQISVFLAKTISDLLDRHERISRERMSENFEPLNAFLRLPQMASLIEFARDPNLTQKVLQELSKESSESNECVKLLICKMMPFVQGMQRSLNFFIGPRVRGETGNKTYLSEDVEGFRFISETDFKGSGSNNSEKSCTDETLLWAMATPIERLYLFLPGTDEFLKNGDVCDDLYRFCFY